ncbi:hypothetical protein SKAU_G00364160 [Synaphobranchus kaupii]|uniref:Uncharacterized protein n=1 Tax=Synaphobranchus kaupii TaxID=118154 RepID=A0A9Q1EES1_SYNKA|nr:hypothetical protein SKAU_G00364160 [Synaphobranchus kaupii]
MPPHHLEPRSPTLWKLRKGGVGGQSSCSSIHSPKETTTTLQAYRPTMGRASRAQMKRTGNTGNTSTTRSDGCLVTGRGGGRGAEHDC